MPVGIQMLAAAGSANEPARLTCIETAAALTTPMPHLHHTYMFIGIGRSVLLCVTQVS